MKLLIVLFSVLTLTCINSCSSQTDFQRHLYLDGFVPNDRELNKIFYSDHFINSVFYLNGDVKSLTIVDTIFETAERIENVYFFNRSKKVERIQKINKFGTIIMDVNFYNYDPRYQFSLNVIKDGFSVEEKPSRFYGNTFYGTPDENEKFVHSSSHFEDKKLIIVKTYRNEVLLEIDSVYYTDGIKPVSITKRSPNGYLRKKQKIEYIGNDIKLYVKSGKRAGSYGQDFYYDWTKNESYSQSLKNIDPITLEYEKREAKRRHKQTFKNEVKVKYSNDSEWVFNQQLNIFTKKNKTKYTIIEFTDNNLPLSKRYLSGNEIYNHKSYSFNSKNDIVKEIFYNTNRENDIEEYRYIYDTSNNWLERRIYLNGKENKMTTRVIEYY